MNFLRKALASDTKIPKATHGKKFTTKERQYYELERMLKHLLTDVKRYSSLWGELLSCKTKIYGYLLYFYNQQSEKRTIIDDLFKFHTSPMEQYINKLIQQYENNLIDEIQQILKIFPSTRKLTSALSLKKHQYLSKKQYYQQLKTNTAKKMDYRELSQVDEEVRINKHTYDFSVRTIIREFEQKVDHKDNILDRFCIRMLDSDAKLYSHLFKTSNILREKSLIFQYYREYPQGLPSYFRDMEHNNNESSDSDNNEEFIMNQLVTNGFDTETIRSLMIVYPNASYDKLLKILTNMKNINKNDDEKDEYKQPKEHITDLIDVYTNNKSVSENKKHFKRSKTVEINLPQNMNMYKRSGKTPPPPPKKDINITPPHKKYIHKQSENNNNNRKKFIKSKSENNNRKIFKQNKALIINTNTIITRNRVHSKSVSSPEDLEQWKSSNKKRIGHRTPPPPPRSNQLKPKNNNQQISYLDLNDEKDNDTMRTHIKRSKTVDIVKLSKPKPPIRTTPVNDKVSDKSHSNSNSPEIQISNTSGAEEINDSDDSLNMNLNSRNYIHKVIESKSDNDINQDEKSVILPQKNVPKRKKKVLSIHYMQVAQLLNKDNKVIPWVWNKGNSGEECAYRYSKPPDKVEEDNKHPLGVGMHTMLNFRHMHQLFHPKQTKNIGDPNSNVTPNKIRANDVVMRSVNINKLRMDINKLDPVVQSMIYSAQRSRNINNIPKPISTQSIVVKPQPQQQQQQLIQVRPVPTPPNGPTPPPPNPPPKRNINDENGIQDK